MGNEVENDPIAENQTELTIAKLTNRQEGDPLLNQAVAAILLSLTKLTAEMAAVKRDLWKPNDLENLIDKRHLSACKECPTRKTVELWEAERQHDIRERAKNSQQGFWSLLFSKEGILIIVILLFALLSIYMTAGRDGYNDIVNTVPLKQGK